MNTKAYNTIVEKYGSWEAYITKRYHDPEKAEMRKRVASLGGKAAPYRHFRDPEVARQAGRKSKRRK